MITAQPSVFSLLKAELASGNAAARGELVSNADIRIIQIESLQKTFEYLVDSELLRQLGIASDNRTLVLKDRDISSKQRNDRLSIQKIMREMKWV